MGDYIRLTAAPLSFIHLVSAETVREKSSLSEHVDTHLGPFYDLDGVEILPVLTEATAAAIERIMGRYLVYANTPSLNGHTLVIDGSLVTRYIQDDWDRVMGERPDLGFLPAYWSTPKAIGRLAEDIVCREVLKDATLVAGERVRRLYMLREAVAQGLVRLPGKGVRSDDLLLETEDGHCCLVESKASLTGCRYLRRSIPKARRQTLKMLEVNPRLDHACYIWTSLREKFVAVLTLDRGRAETTSCAELRLWLHRASAGRVATPRTALAKEQAL